MGGNIEIVDATDQYFFLNAIRIAAESYNEQLVDRIGKLYADRKNSVAMMALTTEPVFYSRYLLFKARTLPLEPLEKLYKELVPRKMTSEEKEEYQNKIVRMVVAVLEIANFTEPYFKKIQQKLTPQNFTDKYVHAWQLIKMLLNEEIIKDDSASVTDQGFAPHYILIVLLDAALE
uniref:Uncharacterized protein n=1 Tax=Panagrolaimus davidi TaxID=227884 RepID=A0A914PYU9_9BILA